MSAEELLPFLNLLLVPMVVHVFKVESRMSKLEAQIDILLRRQK